MKLIEGKHLKAQVVNLKTGKSKPSNGKAMLLPAKEGTCEECATTHDASYPHNAQSLFYQFKFYNDHGRNPTWLDAMAHCDENMQKHWKEELTKRGVKLD